MTQFFAKKLNKKGFTLAELLIVVAIIAVLVAIAVPIFNNSLVKARYGVHSSNGRALKSMAIAELLASPEFTAMDIADDDKFIAHGSYDFDNETFEISTITKYTGSTEPGMWAANTASGEPNSLATWDGSTSNKYTEFDGTTDNINTIGRFGTGKGASKVHYVIIFKGIEVGEDVVKF